jgi:NADH-quinone oxidoreductase subunit H
MDELTTTILIAIAKIGLLIGGLMTAAAYFVLLERRMAAWIQDRKGPNRVGLPLFDRVKLFGLGQPLADGLKFILKEEYTPAHVDKYLYLLAPLAILASALAVFAVIPFGSVLPIDATFGNEAGAEKSLSLIVSSGAGVGVVYVFALNSIAVYGVIIGGWASNSKYSFLGALRSSAQLIAYELPMSLGLLGVVLAAGTLDLNEIIRSQAESGVWFAFAQPLGFIVFFVAAFAEAARLPFDLPETEQELVGGYHTEYSGIKLLLFLVAEFLHMITASFLIVILFLGGWHFWGLGSSDEIGWATGLARLAVLSIKILLVILFFMLVRWTWPRFRFDQLMSLAWKVMLPLGVVNLVAVAVLWELRLILDPRLERAWMAWALAVPSWLVCIGAWWVTAVIAPRIADNRPLVDLNPAAGEPAP